jgi:GTPase SAR1 family protein
MSSSSNPAAQGWVSLFDPNSRRYYYANENTRQSQWEPPEGWAEPAPIPPPPPLAQNQQQQQQQQQQRHPILSHLVYRFGSGNGADPAKFYPRPVTADILGKLPVTFQDVKHDDSVSRILLHGPPGSGKTSIVGVIDKEIRERYEGNNICVFVVRCLEYKSRREEIHNALQEIDECVVILDDAQEWYEFKDLFGLFKNTNRILVAAATFSVGQFNKGTPVEIQAYFSTALRPTELAPMLLNRMKIDVQYHEQVKEWFGDNYGRILLLVPKLFEKFRELQSKDSSMSLSDAFFRGETLQELCTARLMPSLDEDMHAMLTKIWNGIADPAVTQKLARYVSWAKTAIGHANSCGASTSVNFFMSGILTGLRFMTTTYRAPWK